MYSLRTYSVSVLALGHDRLSSDLKLRRLGDVHLRDRVKPGVGSGG